MQVNLIIAAIAIEIKARIMHATFDFTLKFFCIECMVKVRARNEKNKLMLLT